MDWNYGSLSSGLVRVCAIIAAVMVTISLFGVVALGLTGDGEWSLFAQHLDPAALQAAVMA